MLLPLWLDQKPSFGTNVRKEQRLEFILSILLHFVTEHEVQPTILSFPEFVFLSVD
jgi:hypothetical protein